MKPKPMPPIIRKAAVDEIARFKTLKREPITLEEEFDLFGLAMVEWLYEFLQTTKPAPTEIPSLGQDGI